MFRSVLAQVLSLGVFPAFLPLWRLQVIADPNCQGTKNSASRVPILSIRWQDCQAGCLQMLTRRAGRTMQEYRSQVGERKAARGNGMKTARGVPAFSGDVKSARRKRKGRARDPPPRINPGDDRLSHAVARAVPWAGRGGLALPRAARGRPYQNPCSGRERVWPLPVPEPPSGE